MADKACRFCGSLLRVTAHHLIPRALHRKRRYKEQFSREQLHETVPACADCHRMVHKLIPDERRLGAEHFTVDRLLEHPQFADYVRWKRKKSGHQL